MPGGRETQFPEPLLERGEAGENMTRDWRLLEMVIRGETPFAFRFYLWSRPAISHGFGLGERVLEILDLEALSRDGIQVVERPTGGGLLYHGPDLSFGLAVKPFPGAARRVAEAVARGLSLLGVPARVAEKGSLPDRGASWGSRPGGWLCFACASPGEVVAGGRKVAGIARRRVKGGLLFQGSLYLRPGPGRLLSYLSLRLHPGGGAWADGSLAALAGREIGEEEAAEVMGREMSKLDPRRGARSGPPGTDD